MNYTVLSPIMRIRVQGMSLITLILVLTCSTSYGQEEFGLFDHAIDIGPVLHKGTTSFNPHTGSYELSGAGANIWFAKDELHFTYKKLNGDFRLETEGHLIGEGVDTHRKFGWMVRVGLDTSAVMIAAAVHGDGLTSIQFRKQEGGNVEEVKSTMVMPNKIHLERRGRSFFISVAHDGEPFWTVEIPDLDFPEEVYAGLFICSHNAEVVERVEFENVGIVYTEKNK